MVLSVPVKGVLNAEMTTTYLSIHRLASSRAHAGSNNVCCTTPGGGCCWCVGIRLSVLPFAEPTHQQHPYPSSELPRFRCSVCHLAICCFFVHATQPATSGGADSNRCSSRLYGCCRCVPHQPSSTDMTLWFTHQHQLSVCHSTLFSVDLCSRSASDCAEHMIAPKRSVPKQHSRLCVD